MATAAFFDLDRTVLRIDSGMSWMRFQRMRGEISAAMMARAVWWSALYKLSMLDVETLANRMVADLAGDSEADMLEKCAVWYEAFVAHEVAPAAARAIEDHRARGEVPVLLTSSTQYVAEVVARALDMPHTLCSRLGVADGRFTGTMEVICFGRHKVTEAERWAAEHGIDLDGSAFYSDSYNDLPMLARVGRPVVVNPDARLRAHARRVGWPMHDWL